MTRTIQMHVLKVDSGPWYALQSGCKRFEYRRDDRDFGTGDLLALYHVVEDEAFTGAYMIRQVGYILRGPDYGVPEGFVVMSLGHVSDSDIVF